MPLWPDIVVTRPDSPEVLLAVEAKAVVADVKSTEAQIKAYMVHMIETLLAGTANPKVSLQKFGGFCHRLLV